MKALLAGAALGALALFAAAEARASGFALRENSAVTEGEANADMATGTDDLSGITTNPAGMTAFDGYGASAVLVDIMPESHVHITGAGTEVAGLPFALPEGGGDGRDPTVARFVPSLYLLAAPTRDLRLGLGVSVPFGLITNYSSSSAVRYQALFSEIQAIDINPSVAYRVLPWLSLGAGLSVQHVKAKLSNAIDFGTLVPLELEQLGAIGPAQAAALLAAGASRTANDGRAEVSGDSWAAGYDLGLLVEPVKGTRIGLSYRSGIDQKVSGTASFTVPAQYQRLLASTGQFAATDANATVNLPGNVIVGATQALTPGLDLSLTYQWTNWSSFKTLQVNFANPLQAPVVAPENYRDTSFLSVGASFKYSDRLTLRGGLAYDETPTQDGYRDYRLPDGNRYWITTGASYEVSPGITISGSYEHLFFDAVNLDHSVVEVPGVVNVVAGTASTDADLLNAELMVHF